MPATDQMTDERRRELLGATALGAEVLRASPVSAAAGGIVLPTPKASGSSTPPPKNPIVATAGDYDPRSHTPFDWESHPDRKAAVVYIDRCHEYLGQQRRVLTSQCGKNQNIPGWWQSAESKANGDAQDWIVKTQHQLRVGRNQIVQGFPIWDTIAGWMQGVSDPATAELPALITCLERPLPPASAKPSTAPAAAPKPPTQTQPQPAGMSEARRRELLGMTPLGAEALKASPAAAKPATASAAAPPAKPKTAPTTDAGATMSEARRRELLGMTDLGKAAMGNN
jgi:hypothetical protein